MDTKATLTTRNIRLQERDDPESYWRRKPRQRSIGEIRLEQRRNAVITHALPARPTTLRRFPACLGLLVRPLPPGRHVAAVAAVELLGNVVVTSWAPTPIVLFGFHCLALTFKFVCLRYPQSSLRSRQPRQPYDGSYRPRYPSAPRYL